MKMKTISKSTFLRISLLSLTCFLFFISCKKAEVAQNPPQQCFENIDNEIILDLNNLTYTVAHEQDQFNSFIGVRALAMVHLSIHDIFNAIESKFEPYHYKQVSEECKPLAAAAESTRIILTKIYPSRMDTINQVCNKWLNMIEEGVDKAKSVDLGRKVAESYLLLRKNDGHAKQDIYDPTNEPGHYQFTPGYLWAWKPDFKDLKPFMLDSLSQFSSPEPPALTSEEYTASYNETKEFGMKDSKSRSEDQTHIAHWWAESGEHSWNRIGRLTAKEKKLSIIETNRMLALINMNLYDLYLTSFYSKYHHDFWRPYTAITMGESDNNPDTKGDAKWEPEIRTSAWPEYPSMRAAVGAAGAEIVSQVYGTPDVTFTMESVTALPSAKERQYTILGKAADDCADSGVYNGSHFRFSTEEGKKLGKTIAVNTIENYLQPIKKTVPATSD